MKLEIRIVLTAPLVLALAMPALAQVEKAAMRTTGISCGVCAVVSEVNIRRIEGVDEITISMSNETLMISYEPDALFESVEIRKVLESLGRWNHRVPDQRARPCRGSGRKAIFCRRQEPVCPGSSHWKCTPSSIGHAGRG